MSSEENQRLTKTVPSNEELAQELKKYIQTGAK
uniref:Uncharacterized protein n=1 Tax=viral metagenome TaxID=1070528 RepID=A0A6C0CI48_9ZZZZ